jgi:hypothetical protein
MLELSGPVRQVLDFVEEDERLLTVVRGLVQALPEHVVGEPGAELQDGHAQAAHLGNVVELQPEDPTWGDSLAQELLDHLLQQRRLAHLSGPTQHHRRRQTMSEAGQDCLKAQRRSGGTP